MHIEPAVLAVDNGMPQLLCQQWMPMPPASKLPFDLVVLLNYLKPDSVSSNEIEMDPSLSSCMLLSVLVFFIFIIIRMCQSSSISVTCSPGH